MLAGDAPTDGAHIVDLGTDELLKENTIPHGETTSV
jgi:hypothetical protein